MRNAIKMAMNKNFQSNLMMRANIHMIKGFTPVQNQVQRLKIY